MPARRRLAGDDTDDRRRRALGGRCIAAGRDHGSGRGCLRGPGHRHGHDRGARRATLQPFGLQRGDHEQNRQCDRDGLGENQPGLAHERKQK